MTRVPIDIKTSINFGKRHLVNEIRDFADKKDWSVNKTMINLIKRGLESFKKSEKRALKN